MKDLNRTSMKCLKSSALLLVIACSFLQSSAQDQRQLFNEPNYNKRKIFTDLPDKMPLKTASLESLLDLPVGTAVNTTAAKNFHIIGKVVSKSDANDASVKTVVVRLANRDNAILTFTRTTKRDGSFSFIGRIYNRNNGDALEIVKENTQYVLIKKGLYDLISE